jgi:ElaB/YqjD/DUF883 family membrane-anchored ribosome-binding protein
MSTTTEADFRALAAEMKQLREDFTKMAELLQTTVRHAGDDALREAAAAGERTWKEARHRAEDLVGKIEERPVASTVVAFGIGMLLGLLFGNRRA